MRAIAELTLGQLLDSVRARHPLVQAAAARARAARGRRTTAGTLANPIVSYQVENAPFPGGAAPPMDRESMTMAMIPLESIYQRGPRVRRADAELRAATNDAAATRQRVALEATHTFYRAALAHVGVTAARDLVAWLDSLVNYNKMRVTEGVAAEADLLRSELERDRAAADATMREANLARSRAELASFFSERARQEDILVAIANRPLRIPRGLSDAAAAAAIPSPQADRVAHDTLSPALVGSALARRADVVAARERLTAAGAAASSERTMFVRQLSATFGTKRSLGTTSMIAGVSLPFPLFDQNRGEIARAAAEREAASFDLAAQERSARAEIAGAYEAARLLTERVGALAARDGPRGQDQAPAYLAKADEIRRIALGAYREGAVPLLQVLDAARVWGEARITFYTTLFAQHEAVIALLVAQGSDLFAAMPALAGVAPTGPTR